MGKTPGNGNTEEGGRARAAPAGNRMETPGVQKGNKESADPEAKRVKSFMKGMIQQGQIQQKKKSTEKKFGKWAWDLAMRS